MKNVIIILLFVVLIACNKRSKDTDNNDVVDNKIVKDEWIILFDGTSTNQWRGYLSDTIFPEWKIEGDALKFTPSDKAGKNIITKETYTNFILSLEWKISEKGNSGIFWSVYEDEKFPEAYQTGPEIQVLDNASDYSQSNINSKHLAGSLFDMITCSPDLINPTGEWNKCVLKIDHKSNVGSVTMNGKQAFTFAVHGDEWNKMVSNSKFKDWEGFGKYQEGHIGLQDHSDVVWFRNIKIKKL